MAEENRNYFMIIAIVAIVAIVALVIMVSGKGNYATRNVAFNADDSAGQAIATQTIGTKGTVDTKIGAPLSSVKLTSASFTGGGTALCGTGAAGTEYWLGEDINYAGVIAIGPGCTFSCKNKETNVFQKLVSTGSQSPTVPFVESSSNINECTGTGYIQSTGRNVVVLLKGNAVMDWTTVIGGTQQGLKLQENAKAMNTVVKDSATGFEATGNSMLDHVEARNCNLGFKLKDTTQTTVAKAYNCATSFDMSGYSYVFGGRAIDMAQNRVGFIVSENAFFKNSFCNAVSTTGTTCVKMKGSSTAEVVQVTGANVGFKIEYPASNVNLIQTSAAHGNTGYEVGASTRVFMDRVQGNVNGVGLKTLGSTWGTDIVAARTSYFCGNTGLDVQTSHQNTLHIFGTLKADNIQGSGYIIETGGLVTICPGGPIGNGTGIAGGEPVFY